MSPQRPNFEFSLEFSDVLPAGGALFEHVTTPDLGLNNFFFGLRHLIVEMLAV